MNDMEHPFDLDGIVETHNKGQFCCIILDVQWQKIFEMPGQSWPCPRNLAEYKMSCRSVSLFASKLRNVGVPLIHIMEKCRLPNSQMQGLARHFYYNRRELLVSETQTPGSEPERIDLACFGNRDKPHYLGEPVLIKTGLSPFYASDLADFMHRQNYTSFGLVSNDRKGSALLAIADGLRAGFGVAGFADMIQDFRDISIGSPRQRESLCREAYDGIDWLATNYYDVKNGNIPTTEAPPPGLLLTSGTRLIARLKQQASCNHIPIPKGPG